MTSQVATQRDREKTKTVEVTGDLRGLWRSIWRDMMAEWWGGVTHRCTPYIDTSSKIGKKSLTVLGAQLWDCGSRPELPVSLPHTSILAVTPCGSCRRRRMWFGLMWILHPGIFLIKQDTEELNISSFTCGCTWNHSLNEYLKWMNFTHSSRPRFYLFTLLNYLRMYLNLFYLLSSTTTLL